MKKTIQARGSGTPDPLVRQVRLRDKKVKRLLECLDQIAGMTKNGRAARLARACAAFERTLPDAYQPPKEGT